LKPGYFALVVISIIVTQLIVIYLIYYRSIIQEIFSLPKGNPKEFIKKIIENPDRIVNKKRIAFIGDSITHGNMSVNFIKLIANEIGIKQFDYINGGLNASLSYNVLQRLPDIIECQPDISIILIGTNDAHRSIQLYKHSITNNRIQLPKQPDKNWFIENLRKIVTELKEKTNSKIAICSLPPIGEDISHEIFRLCIDYSKSIKDITEEMNISYLPVNEKMIEYLKLNPSKQKFPTEKKLYGLAAALHYFLDLELDQISKYYGFSLLVDHLHLNSKGAKIVADLIIDYIKSI
jgi:lysophospholipase L1-like esterase